MKEVMVSQEVARLLDKGQLRLPDKSYFNQALPEDQLVKLLTKKNRELGYAYISQQNKGMGWLVPECQGYLNQDFFKNLFGKAHARRQNLEGSDLTTAYRLFNQDGDGFGGLTIDRYGDFALFSWYNTFVYSLRETVMAAFREVFPDLKGAYEKLRFKTDLPLSQHAYGQEQEAPFTILENGIAYEVFLNDGLMTGIFLDQRLIRERLLDGMALGKKVLNLFSYTAAFSVASAMGGSLETVSVDLAKRSQSLSQAHFEANGLALNDHRFVVMDCFAYLAYAKRHGLTFDLVVIDPPSFARNKKQVFSVAKDYHRLIAGVLPLLNPGGTIIASTNAANLSVEQFRKELDKGFAGTKHEYVSLDRLPEDFRVVPADPQSNYLKIFTIQVTP